MTENTTTTGENSLSEILEVTALAGHILLENGAEISRVEETMERISRYYGASESNFFVLSNGIFTTGKSSKGAQEYANVEFIPFKGASLDRVVYVNQLSREIIAGKHTLEEAKARLEEIRAMGEKPIWEQILGSAIGSAGFCAIFGGSVIDCAASCIAGLLLWIFVILWGGKRSKILGNVLGSALVSLICILFFSVGFGEGLSHMIIGSIIPLIPGIPFTNGIRDMANGDYIAGSTRLLDAMIVFLCIAFGVCVTFSVYSHIAGGMIIL